MPVAFKSGTSPLILAFPNVGSTIPPAIYERLTEDGRANRDTDWHLTKLFDWAGYDVSFVQANFSPALANVNCLPGAKAAAGDNRPRLVSDHDHTGAPIWSQPPRPQELRNWRSAFFVPYHAALAAQIARIRAQHGFAIVLDCAVYRRDLDVAPFGLSVRTRMGLSCDTMLAARLVTLLQTFGEPTAGLDNSGEPGWTVKHYGKPRSGVHAIELRLDARTFLASTEEPWPFDPSKARALAPILEDAIGFLKNWAPGANRLLSRVHGT
jgi:formiminoglutamase